MREGTMSALSRRGFIVLTGGAAASGLSACATTSSPRPHGPSDPLAELPAAEAAAQIRAGILSAERYGGALTAPTPACQPVTTAYISSSADALRAAARAADQARARNRRLGALHGVPLAVKDNINTRGVPTSGGTRALAGNQTPADAPVWARLRAAGALIARQTSLHNLPFAITNTTP